MGAVRGSGLALTLNFPGTEKGDACQHLKEGTQAAR